MLIFLDTEFTDLLDPMLISIGMIADSGEEFYAEVPFSDVACSTFVRDAVIPLLNRYPPLPKRMQGSFRPITSQSVG